MSISLDETKMQHIIDSIFNFEVDNEEGSPVIGDFVNDKENFKEMLLCLIANL